MFHCSQQIQMRFKDIDMFQHVNNTVYFEYMDYGKSQYISQVLGPLFDPANDAMVIVNVNCNFLNPTRYDETVNVETRVDAIGEHSVTFVQRIINPVIDEIKCEARIVMVGYNARRAESIVIPDEWRESISKFEGRNF